MSSIYLDNASAARPSLRTLERMAPLLEEQWMPLTAPYPAAQSGIKQYQTALKTAYHALGASEEDTVLFTSSGAEAVTTVVQSVYQAITRRKGKNGFLSAGTDEASILVAQGDLEEYGCSVQLLNPSAEGIITIDELVRSLSPRTALLSLCCVNGLTGVVQPLEEISALCKERGVLLHIEITHLFGKDELELKEIQPDYLTLNGSQQHGPGGTGLLYVKAGAPLSPLIKGGNEQAALRGGHANLALWSGLATALVEAQDSFDLLATEVARLRTLFEQRLLEALPGAQVLFSRSMRAPHITAIAFSGVLAEALHFVLAQRGVAATIGGGLFQQLTLNAMSCQLPEEVAATAISFCLSRYTSEAELMTAAEIIIEETERLQQISHHLQESR